VKRKEEGDRKELYRAECAGKANRVQDACIMLPSLFSLALKLRPSCNW
jgi:hypothetical protein